MLEHPQVAPRRASHKITEAETARARSSAESVGLSPS